ncbi:MAG: TonB-dependent receptor [Prolixibacteraceae bacterium]|jgi:hypothetical protein|nr:TonB-dependent receptor [Prolixibacteraceae bacterium]
MIKTLVTLSILFFTCTLSSGKTINLSGYIEDAKSGERLIGASIYNLNTNRGTVTNDYGFFSLSVKQSDSLLTSFIGYKSGRIVCNSSKDTTVIFKLELKSEFLLEIEVVANSKNLKENVSNIVSLSPKLVERLPVILGETDVLKSFQLMPGVQGGIEGTAGMIVRGSDPSQNLILLDGVPVYNVNHLFGLFSVFNNDAIKSSKLYKGDFPASYGGRAASVVDIRMKEGNNKEMKGSVSAGLISAKGFIEGPIVKDKSSFMISARRTYIDVFLYPYFKIMLKDEYSTSYAFYDVNGKINYKLNDRNKIYLSYYSGNDGYYQSSSTSIKRSENTITDIKQKSTIDWGNHTGTFRWNSQLGNKLFCNTTLTLSQYKFSTGRMFDEIEKGDPPIRNKLETEFYSGIFDKGAAVQFDYFHSGRNFIEFGVNFTNHRFKPGVNVFDFSDLEGVIESDSVKNTKTYSNNEIALYFQDNFKIENILNLSAGIRFSRFDTENINYDFLEPRASLSLLFIPRSSLGISYSKTSQPIHLLVNSSVGFPTDQWVPVTKNIKPIVANQFNVSFQNEINPYFNISLGVYLKQMDNLLEYIDNADKKKNWEEIVEHGQGTAKGVELLIEKKLGKTQGWIAYTLSNSERVFEIIIYGNPYPYKYDRKHDFKIVVTHQFNERVNVSASWIFNTGNAVTLPTENYSINYSRHFSEYAYGAEIISYRKKNDFRMPNYHRLDLSANFEKQKEKTKRVFSIGLYNAYMHRNALYYDFYEGRLRSHSVLPIMPSINYTIEF